MAKIPFFTNGKSAWEYVKDKIYGNLGSLGKKLKERLSKALGKIDGPNKQKEEITSKKWFVDDVIKSVKNNDYSALNKFSSPVKNFSDDFIGKMILFNYDPKWKHKLPYYDIYPLIFPIEIYKDGFLGINLHYLPKKERAILMVALFTILSDKNFDENTKLNISYKVLKESIKFKLFKPCVKRYLNAHIRSSFYKINTNMWNLVLMLPLEKFQKQGIDVVYRDSLNMVK